MFSGIIEHQAKILSREWGLFRVENSYSDGLKIGQSIAHDGACMTLTNITGEYYEFFVMEESLRVTNLGEKKSWDTFNIERCIALGDRLDGHIVSGHIDTVGRVSKLEKKDDGSLIFWVDFDPTYSHLIIEKGSVSLNGTSLTIVEAWNWYLSVSLIPLTQDWTNLGTAKLWDAINIEFDMIGKYIQRLTIKN